MTLTPSRPPLAQEVITEPLMRALSPRAQAAVAAGDWEEALPLLEAEVAACERTARTPVECYELNFEAGSAAFPATVAAGAMGTRAGRSADQALRSEAYVRRAVALAREYFPPDDHRIASADAYLGLMLSSPLAGRPEQSRRRLEEAEVLLRNALAFLETRPDALETFDWRQTLSGVLSSLHRPAEANAILASRVEAERKTGGGRHWPLWSHLQDLAFGLGFVGDHAGAEAAWREALDLAEPHYPADDVQVLRLRAGLASARYVIGDLDGAMAQHAKIQTEIEFSLFDIQNPTYVTEYASLLQAVGRQQEALALMEGRVRSLLARWGPTHRDTRAAGQSLAMLLASMDRFQDAAELFTVLVPLEAQEVGAEAMSTLMLRSSYAVVLARIGNGDHALIEAESSLAGLRVLSTQNQHLLVPPLFVLGLLRLSAGDVPAAREPLSEALALSLARWCEDHATRSDRGWSGADERCRPDGALTAIASMAALAELRGDPRPERAARVFSHAGDMAVGRSRLRYSSDPLARRDFDRSRYIHAGFVTAAWTVHDPEASRQVAETPVLTEFSMMGLVN